MTSYITRTIKAFLIVMVVFAGIILPATAQKVSLRIVFEDESGTVTLDFDARTFSTVMDETGEEVVSGTFTFDPETGKLCETSDDYTSCGDFSQYKAELGHSFTISTEDGDKLQATVIRIASD